MTGWMTENSSNGTTPQPSTGGGRHPHYGDQDKNEIEQYQKQHCSSVVGVAIVAGAFSGAVAAIPLEMS